MVAYEGLVSRTWGPVRVSSHQDAQGTPDLPWWPLGVRNNLPFSSTAYTEVWPTDTCFNLCFGGDGMWCQQSPATGSWTWMLETSNLRPQHSGAQASTAADGAGRVFWHLSPGWQNHTGVLGPGVS